MPKLRLGTRGSRLAMAQATAMRERLLQACPGGDVEIVPIKTSGDRGERERLGAFVREIQEALLRNEVDLALHCLKDLPTEPVPGLVLCAYLEREDARDAFISRGPSLSELPQGAVVGTGSVRRTSQLAARFPGLTFKPLVGNVDTRLRKLAEGEYDAIILAIAGMKRLDLLHEDGGLHEYPTLRVRALESDEMLPAPGQAVLVLESRADDPVAMEWVRPMHSEASAIAATSERAFLSAFGGGCSVPVASFAEVAGGEMMLEGLVAAPNGSKVLRGTRRGNATQGVFLARDLAEDLARQGARELFEPDGRAQGGPER